VSGAEWAVLVPAIAGVLGAVRAYIKAAAASRSAQAAHARIDSLVPGPNVKAQP
jgi:hypothetical protein